MTHEEADSGNTNPGYNPKSRAFTENCQSCVYAYEMRLRGYDVHAKGYDIRNKDQNDLAKFMNLGWVDENGKKPNPPFNTKEIINYYKQGNDIRKQLEDD